MSLNQRTIASREWRSENPERAREINRRAQANRRDRDPEGVLAVARRYRQTHREAVRARSLVGKRVQRGLLIRPDACMDCGSECRPQAHHDDYSKPLEIRWLCRDCHWKRHPGPLQKSNRPGTASAPREAAAGAFRSTNTA